MSIVMTNGFFILAMAVLFACIVSPWWHGALFGVGWASIACLLTDIVLTCIRAVVQEPKP